VTGGGSGTNAQGGAGNPVGDGVDNDRPGERGEAELAAVGGPSDILDAAAIATAADFTETQTNRANNEGEVTVAARDVVATYEARAVDALDRLNLAPSEASTVESYFDVLREGVGDPP